MEPVNLCAVCDSPTPCTVCADCRNKEARDWQRDHIKMLTRSITEMMLEALDRNEIPESASLRDLSALLPKFAREHHRKLTA